MKWETRTRKDYERFTRKIEGKDEFWNYYLERESLRLFITLNGGRLVRCHYRFGKNDRHRVIENLIMKRSMRINENRHEMD